MSASALLASDAVSGHRRLVKPIAGTEFPNISMLRLTSRTFPTDTSRMI
jgi:hypothetical protein